jgi:hypothetical protein
MRPRCASRVLAIGGAHLLSAPRSRAGPVGAAQRDRVPEMPSRRLVASALIRPIVKLPVRSLRRRHLHRYPCRPPLRLRARTEALTPLAPGRASAARWSRTTRSRVPVRPFRGDACDRRGTRGWRGRSARPKGCPTGGAESAHSESSPPACGGRPSHPHPEIESPGSASSRLREWAPSRRRRLVEPPGARHLSRMSCSPQCTQ